MISVIIPTYNRAHCVTKALVSVLEQTYTDYEIIVVDDGSTDTTVAVVNDFIEKYPEKAIRLHVRKENSGGPAAPKNDGIKQAHGEYIAILDADDTWEADKLALQMELLESNPTTEVVGCDYTQVFATTTQTISTDYSKALLYKDKGGPGSCMLYKRSLFDTVGLFDESLKSGQDWDMRIRIVEQHVIAKVGQPLVRYHMLDDSVSQKNPKKLLRDLRRITKKHLGVLLRHPMLGLQHLALLVARHISYLIRSR